MQKVKVHRYVSGKRPEYAPVSSSEEESEEEDFVGKRVVAASQSLTTVVPGKSGRAASDEDEAQIDDPRLRRLKGRKVEDSRADSDEEAKIERHRFVEIKKLLTQLYFFKNILLYHKAMLDIGFI